MDKSAKTAGSGSAPTPQPNPKDKSPKIVSLIRGKRVATGAHRPFFLDDPEKVVYVEEPPKKDKEESAEGDGTKNAGQDDGKDGGEERRQGHLDIFAVEVEGDEVQRRRLHVARIPEGGMAVGVHGVQRPGGSTTTKLLAVPSQDALVVEGERAGLMGRENFDLDILELIENWILELSTFLVRDGQRVPRDANLIEADPNMAYPAKAAVTAHHKIIVWASVNQQTLVNGSPRHPLAADDLLPLSERTWLELETDSRVTAIMTPAAFFNGSLWQALERFSSIALEHAIVRTDMQARAAADRHSAVHRSRLASATRMFRRLGAVLDSSRGPRTQPPAAATPLQTVLALVIEALGVPFEPPRVPQNETDAIEAISTLARRSGVRVRRIIFDEDWWKRDGLPLVGVSTEGRRLLALLPNDRGGYQAVDPEVGESFTVGPRTARRIAPVGLMLYAPLPAEVRSGGRALLHTLRGRAADLWMVLSMAGIGALLALTTPVLTGRLLAEIIPRVDTSMWASALAALVLAAFGGAAFEIVRALATLRIEGRVDEKLQAAIWARLLSLPVPFFRDYTAGDLADRANGIAMIRQALTGATMTAVIGGVFSLFSFGLLFYYSWRLALCATALMMLLGAATWFFARGQMSHHRAAFRIQGTIDGLVFQMIRGLSKLRIANSETYALARWADRFSEQKRETLAARRWAAGQLAFNSMFTPLASLVLFAFIWYELIDAGRQATFGLADFLSFNAAFGQFVAAMTGLTAAWTMVISVIPMFERVQPILEAEPETAEAGIDPGDLAGEIEFANIVFRYLPGLPNALDGVSFHIDSGDYVAFVGPSGSGKSTVYRVLLGFERPNSGAVFLDGHDLLSLDLPSVRSRMGVVLQHSELAAASIFKNIASSSPLSMDEAWAAARAAGLDKDIEEMPMGMHTMLPEGGAGLSGGQRQRLLIARALARKPRIMLFDEATSALDNRTQAVVQESLRRMNMTRIVIAHRLSTVQDADRIYVMKKGRIVESGKYNELMERKGVFANLAQRQLV